MNVIEAARQLGKVIQADERFRRLTLSQERNNADQALQDKINAFNEKRAKLNAELQKDDKDSDTIKELDGQLKGMYAKIFENPNMMEFSAAKRDMEQMIAEINQIVGGSASGLNPDEIDPSASSCGGDCGGCAGCN